MLTFPSGPGKDPMQQHHIRPDGLPPVNGYSHAVAFSGRMVAVSGQVPLDGQGRLAGLVGHVPAPFTRKRDDSPAASPPVSGGMA
jgi:hypothetical protein